MRYLSIFISTFCVFSFYSCSEDTGDGVGPLHSSTIIVDSYPTGAAIYLDNNNTGKVTPDSLQNIYSGSHQVKLVLSGYQDKIIDLTVAPDSRIVIDGIILIQSTGSIRLYSSPTGVQIWKSGVNTNKITPDSLTALSIGDYSITLKLYGYKDTTFALSVVGGKATSKQVALTIMPLLIDAYSNIRLYEKSGSGFSGLILATGTRALSTGSTTDLFYDGTSGKDSIYSQHLRSPSSASRYTDFFKGSASDLNDGVDASLYSYSSGLWKYAMSASVGNYYFIYDHDFHYSKIKVVAVGGGTGPTDPDKWVDVSYKYNKTSKDTRF